MQNAKQMKMETPVRIAELDPMGTLRRIGLGENDAICDIGAGSGIFTVAAAQITREKVYALEIDDKMLDIIAAKADSIAASNIEPVRVEGDRLELTDQSVDLVIMVTVLHEILNTDALLKEVKRMLKKGGRIMVIEFHKSETPMGPPESHRIDRKETVKIIEDFGFSITEDFDLGENFYCVIFH